MINGEYYAQSQDLHGKNIYSDYLPYKTFRKIRDAGNKISEMSGYDSLLKDKLLFERYFSSGDFNVIESLGLLTADGHAEIFKIPAKGQFLSLYRQYFIGRELFVKPRLGIKGKGAFKFSADENGVMVNNRCVDDQYIFGLISSPCLIQPLLHQHTIISDLHPDSLNTLRIITFHSEGGIRIFLAYLRIAAGGNITDNNPVSRIVARVDTRTGCLERNGYWIKKSGVMPVCEHPDTGVRFSEVVMPHFKECLELTKAAHALIPSMQSVGWDVAITPQGPILMEGNQDWGARTAYWVMPDFVQEFRKLLTAPSPP
jgi:hypothetical protein